MQSDDIGLILCTPFFFLPVQELPLGRRWLFGQDGAFDQGPPVFV